MDKIGFGGGCHWCTEAIFKSLIGVHQVEQGWISSVIPAESWSEAVIVHFDSKVISLDVLVEIHLLTHSSSSVHAFRQKYRSAIYFFDDNQKQKINGILNFLQSNHDKIFITQILPFVGFKINQELYLDYYHKNPENQFCQRYINPKLDLLRNQFSKHFLNPSANETIKDHHTQF